MSHHGINFSAHTTCPNMQLMSKSVLGHRVAQQSTWGATWKWSDRVWSFSAATQGFRFCLSASCENSISRLWYLAESCPNKMFLISFQELASQKKVNFEMCLETNGTLLTLKQHGWTFTGLNFKMYECAIPEIHPFEVANCCACIY